MADYICELNDATSEVWSSEAFVKEGSSLTETFRQPAEARYNDRRYPRTAPGIAQFSIAGPYAPQGAGDTPSRRRLFTCHPSATNRGDEEKCAASILSTVVRRAYRRPVVRAELDEPMAFYRRARRFRCRHRGRAERGPVQPRVSVSRGNRPEESARGRRV